MANKNNWQAKARRTFTSILPVSKERKGKCIHCGKCCMLPNACPFLRHKDGKAHCIIYSFRPLNCKKYPRTKEEFITAETCGYKFND